MKQTAFFDISNISFRGKKILMSYLLGTFPSWFYLYSKSALWSFLQTPWKLESIINKHPVEKTQTTSGISEGDFIQGTGYNFVGRDGRGKQVEPVVTDTVLRKMAMLLRQEEGKGKWCCHCLWNAWSSFCFLDWMLIDNGSYFQGIYKNDHRADLEYKWNNGGKAQVHRPPRLLLLLFLLLLVPHLWPLSMQPGAPTLRCFRNQKLLGPTDTCSHS